ncbi:MAG TPA: hypothetical protein VHR47_00530 [Bacillota bacterium]|nr:hypothetical protein [Bacillota bacterium]
MIEELFVVQLQLKLAQRRYETLKADDTISEYELSEAGEEVGRLTDEYNRLKRLSKH